MLEQKAVAVQRIKEFMVGVVKTVKVDLRQLVVREVAQVITGNDFMEEVKKVMHDGAKEPDASVTATLSSDECPPSEAVPEPVGGNVDVELP
jgi:hypothetical protein